MNLNTTSYTELNTIAQCEMRWAHKYLYRTDQGEKTTGLAKGTWLHDVVGQWWWDPTLSMDEIVRHARNAQADLPWVEDAVWVANRYEQHYFADRAEVVETVGREVRLELDLPGTGVRVVAWIDEIRRDAQGGLWLVERKTMLNWARLSLLPVDPQITTYLWIARASGLPVVGVLFDAIRTYHWAPEKPTLTELQGEVLTEQPELTKKAAMEIARERQAAHPGFERPLAESFEQLWLDRTDEQIEEGLDEMRAALVRRQMLAGGLRPVRNLGEQCNRCPFKNECWDAVAFPEEIEIEDE